MFSSEYKEYKKYHVFAGVTLEIEQILKIKILSKQEKATLKELQEKIRVFEHLQKNWLRDTGLLSNYSKTYLLPHPLRESDAQFQTINQKKLNKEVKETAYQSALNAETMALQLLSYMDIKSHSLKRLIGSSMLERVRECARKISENAQDISAEVKYFNLHMAESIYKLATLLGGRYLFFQQDLDPISDDVDGFCYGYVMSWKNEIEKTGRYHACPRNDRDTFKVQMTQKFSTYTSVRECHSIMGIWSCIDRFLGKVDTNSIYELSYYRKKTAHAMGLRKLKAGEIEFFDPNHGLFVFPNHHAFRIWICELLSNYLAEEKNSFNLCLGKRGNQPKDAFASIPVISRPINDKNNYQWVSHHYSYKYHQTEFSIDDFKRLLKRMNKKSRIEFHYDNSIVKRNIEFEIDGLIKSMLDKGDGYSNIVNLNMQNKIIALKELKLRINNAAPTMTTIGLIESWLADKPDGGSETYETIIKTKLPTNKDLEDTKVFVRKLMTSYEINVDGMIALQVNLLMNILLVIKVKKKSDPDYAPILFKMLDASFQKNHIHTQKLIDLLKRRCVWNYGGLFAEKKWNENSNINDASMSLFYKLLKELNPDQLPSLIKTSKAMNQIVNSLEKSYCEKSDLFNEPKKTFNF